jgi:hypothetical protein
MDRYFEEHRHRPDVCPAGNPEMADMLAGHLSPVITCEIVTAKAQD